MFNSVYRLGFAFNLRNLSTRCILVNCHKHNLKLYQQRCYKGTESDEKKKIMAELMSKVIPNNTTSCPDIKKFNNRLLTENSPYLLQHAHNPVDWYPWCDEAIQKAKAENKLIFLSVGYSTCHWCHVMEKESFEDEEVAKIMNENFINIKVDREERPDIDKIYMTFVLMVSGSGGWPMSVWLTPDLAPVTAGTYFPPTDRWGMAGFKSVLLRLAKKWNESGAEMTVSGRSIIDIIQKQANEKSAVKSDDDILTVEGKYKQCVKIFTRNYDDDYGGFGRAPKFPEVSKLNLLLHMFLIDPKNGLVDSVLHTLKKIANGGIHDHVFGGFARYAVDRKWHVPHFEKMLYDQGQLLMAYTNAYKITRDKFFLEVSNSIFKYLMQDLLHPRGGFYSGEDADSFPTHESKDKIEGAFYAWTFNEINAFFEENENKFINIFKIDPFEVYCFHYDIKENGNVEPSSDPHGHLLEKNILFVNGSIEQTAKKFRVTNTVIEDVLRIGNTILYEVRCKRPRPHLDTKIICSWNGLILSGLSKLACIKDAPRRQDYQNAAKDLVDFIHNNLYNSEDGTLLRSCYGDNDSDNITNISVPISGFLDDYAFLIKGLLDYYVITMDETVLHWAKNLQDTQDKLFWDDKNGGYFYSQENSPNVVIRLKEDHDGAEPCGNSVSLHNLLSLSAYFDDKLYKDKATKLLDYFNNITPFGYALPEMMSGLLLYDKGLDMLIIVGSSDNEDTKNLLDATRNYYTPGLITILSKINEPEKLTRKAAAQFKMIGKRPTAYLCHNKICQLPLTDPAMLSETFAEKFLYKCDK